MDKNFSMKLDEQGLPELQTQERQAENRQMAQNGVALTNPQSQAITLDEFKFPNISFDNYRQSVGLGAAIPQEVSMQKQPVLQGIAQNEQKQGKFPVTQPFGNYNPQYEVFSGGVNNGTDFGVTYQTPFHVPEGEWEVIESFAGANPDGGFIGNQVNNGYGNSVVIKNRKTGETMRYSHLSAVGVEPGELVSGGKTLGLSGNSGNSSGSHLDLEYRDGTGQLADVLNSPYARYF
jgi:murein DD-endopeptidase MepM/ murein hydrolase activator NlpD